MFTMKSSILIRKLFTIEIGMFQRFLTCIVCAILLANAPMGHVPVYIASAPALAGKTQAFPSPIPQFTSGGFAPRSYNQQHSLTLAPTLSWNTFLGKGGYDIVMDSSGNVYIEGGSSTSWGSPVMPFTGSHDTFVAKLDSSGNLIWNTFFGGDVAGINVYSMGIDDSGNIYIAGTSYTGWGNPIRAYGDNVDAFVAKLDSSGHLMWNTFLGGPSHFDQQTDYGFDIAVDGSGNIYVTGQSFGTWGNPIHAYASLPPDYSPNGDAFVAKLDTSGNLAWNTFLGSTGTDLSSGISVDSSGNVYLTGMSQATWGSPIQAFHSGFDAFLARLDPSGNLVWNTFMGGSGSDYGQQIALDSSGNIYITGMSKAAWGSPVRAFSAASEDAFVTKLDPSGNLTWNTFFGGSGDEYGESIQIGNSGNLYIIGNSSATWGNPTRAYTAAEDAFVASVDSSGHLIGNTFLGGNGNDQGNAIVSDGNRNVYAIGLSASTWGSPLQAYTTGTDTTFIAKVNFPPAAYSSVRANANPTNSTSVDFTVSFSEPVTGVDTGDFSLSTAGVTGASVTNVSGSGTTYTITVDTGSSDGSLRLDVLDDDSILAADSTPLGGQVQTTAVSIQVRPIPLIEPQPPFHRLFVPTLTPLPQPA